MRVACGSIVAGVQIPEHIAGLSAIERGSATAGERASAEWIAGRLAELGAGDIEFDEFEYATTFAHAQGLHFAAGGLAALRGSRLLAAAALASFELEFSGRRQWTRPFLPRGTGVNVTARLPARGARRRTLVLVAHHDAARTGLMWDPRLTGPGDRAAARSGRRASLALLPELALAAVAVAGRRARPLRLAAAGVLGLALALAFEQSHSPSVPGANDNASGVAALLEVVRQLEAERPEGLEVLLVFPGCEESGMGGMAAWLAGSRARLDRDATLVVGLDTVGSGQPIVLTGEGGLWPVGYDAAEVRLAVDAARAVGVELRPWRIGGWTDPALARLAGLRTVSILSVRDGGFPNYHLPSDLPEAVDVGCARDCVRTTVAIAREFAA